MMECKNFKSENERKEIKKTKKEGIKIKNVFSFVFVCTNCDVNISIKNVITATIECRIENIRMYILFFFLAANIPITNSGNTNEQNKSPENTKYAFLIFFFFNFFFFF